jgi:hypothetical protein
MNTARQVQNLEEIKARQIALAEWALAEWWWERDPHCLIVFEKMAVRAQKTDGRIAALEKLESGEAYDG